MRQLLLDRIQKPSLKSGTVVKREGFDGQFIVIERGKTYDRGFLDRNPNYIALYTYMGETPHFYICKRHIYITPLDGEMPRKLAVISNNTTGRKFLDDTVEEVCEEYGDVNITEGDTCITIGNGYYISIENYSGKIQLEKYSTRFHRYRLKLVNRHDIIDIILQTLYKMTPNLSNDDLRLHEAYEMSLWKIDNFARKLYDNVTKNYYTVSTTEKTALCLNKLREVKNKFPKEYEEAIVAERWAYRVRCNVNLRLLLLKLNQET